MATDRQTPCLFYICAGLCKKGRKADHAHYCQQETDEWLRHKIRTIYWKQWKKVKTKFKELKKLGVEEEKAWICANMRNGNWYCGGYFVLQTAFNNKKLRELGYPTFTEFYLKECEN